MADKAEPATGSRAFNLKKDGTPKAKRGEAVVKVRPAYLVYTVDDGILTVHSVTRKADDVLAATAGQTEKKYARIEI
jgi:hypothetical protein